MAKKVGRPKKVDLIIETNKAEIEYQRDGTNYDFKYDGKKVDLHITKDETGTKVEVVSENKFLKALATLASKFIVKRFKKK
jgi:hypothetical protein